MEDNRNNANFEDDFSLEDEFAPIELKAETVEQNMRVTNIPQGRGSIAVPDIMRIGVIVMSVFLAIDMFLPYITISILGDNITRTSSLFPGRFALAFLAIVIVMLVSLFLRKEKYMIFAGIASVVVCFRAASRASYGRFAVNVSAGNSGLDMTIKYGFGYYGMIVGALGLALFTLGYILSTDIGKAWKN